MVTEYKKLKALGFCQDIIKQAEAFELMILAERRTMGIGIGSIGSAIGSAAGSVGRAAGGVGRGGGFSGGIRSGIESGGGGPRGPVSTSGLGRFDQSPAMGGLGKPGGFGELRGFGGPGPVNEGPVGLADLKTTVPLQELFKPIGEIRFNSVPELNVADAIAEAEAVISQAQKPHAPFSNFQYPTSNWDVEPRIIPQVLPMIGPASRPIGLEYPKPEVVVSPAVEPATEPVVESSTKTESMASSKPTATILVQPALEEQEIQQETITERATNEQLDIVNEEKISRNKKFVVDQPTLANRLQKVVQAVQQAKPEAERLGLGKKIIGWIVDKFFSLNHPGDISRVVRPEGPDGTIPATKDEIRATAEFESEEQVQAAVLNNIPVSAEEEGESVSDEQVRKVFQDRIVKPDRPNQPVEIMKKRTVQKKQKLPEQRPVLTLVSKQAEAKKENNLEDLGLTEVFQKKVA